MLAKKANFTAFQHTHVRIYMNIDREVEKIFMQILEIYLVCYFGIFKVFMEIFKIVFKFCRIPAFI
jgi:hypothetical protein